jgi:hypothetical protein
MGIAEMYRWLAVCELLSALLEESAGLFEDWMELCVCVCERERESDVVS